jgi:hypothetical protein
MKKRRRVSDGVALDIHRPKGIETMDDLSYHDTPDPVELPRRPRGRPTLAAKQAYKASIARFCACIREIKKRIDFDVGTRGWCYLLETYHFITKGEFDDAERVITECRKSGDLPLNICAEDSKRAVDGVQDIDDPDIETAADNFAIEMANSYLTYTPFAFWDTVDVYIEVAVEKSDLKSLFAVVTDEFYIPSQNIGGWADLNVRAGMMRRFKYWEARGKRCILLYCGDHDPGGLNISDFLRANLEELAEAVGWSPKNLIIKRFGLDYDFIEANGLTWIDNLETSSGKSLDDPGHRDHGKRYVQDYIARFGVRKVEANALVARPQEGRELCRQAILEHVSEDQLEAYNARLDEEREKLRLVIEARAEDRS